MCGALGDSFNETCYIYDVASQGWQEIYKYDNPVKGMASVPLGNWMLFIGQGASEKSNTMLISSSGNK